MSERGGLKGLWDDFSDYLGVDIEVTQDVSPNVKLPVIIKFTVTNNGQAQEDRPEIIFEEVQLEVSVAPDQWIEKTENLASGQSFTYEHHCSYDAIMQMQWFIKGRISPESLLQFRRKPTSINKKEQFPVDAYFDFLEQLNIHKWLDNPLKSLDAPGPDTTLAEMKEKEETLTNTISEIRGSAQQLKDFFGFVNYKKNRDDIIPYNNQIQEYLNITEREITELIKTLKSNRPDRFETVRNNIVAKLNSSTDSLNETTNLLARKLGLVEENPDIDGEKDVSHGVQPPPPITLREIDLHGNTLETTIPIVNKFLEECYQDNVRRVRIIHGKGIFVLQKAIREILGTHKLVKDESISAADKDHGGEGATEANLIDFSANNLN